MGSGKKYLHGYSQCSTRRALIKCIKQSLPEKESTGCTERERIYYKKSVHVIMEAGKSEDLQGEPESWRPSGLILSESKGLRIIRAHHVVPGQEPAGARPTQS